jgi:hypothetical protein
MGTILPPGGEEGILEIELKMIREHLFLEKNDKTLRKSMPCIANH